MVGIIIGVVFYLIINQTLAAELNPLQIPPYTYQGSALLGFFGGLLSYEIVKVKPSLTPGE
jgi:hypothetical protein